MLRKSGRLSARPRIADRNLQKKTAGEVATVTSMVVMNIAATQVEKVRTIELVMSRLQELRPDRPVAMG